MAVFCFPTIFKMYVYFQIQHEKCLTVFLCILNLFQILQFVRAIYLFCPVLKLIYSLRALVLSMTI